MRFLLITLSIILPIASLLSQGLLNNGARIVLQSGSNVVIAGNGNWTNNGTINCNANSTVQFTGTANQTISGTNTTAFGNLTINNTGGDVIVGRDISVQTTLQMNNGDFDLKDNNVDLGTSGSISNEASARRIKATDGGGFDGQGTGTIFATRNNPSGNVAGLGLNITPAGNMGSTVIIRGHERQQGTGTYAGNYSIFRYYEIQPTTYYNNSFVFNYYPAWELNGHSDGNLIAFQRVQYSWGGTPGPVYWEPLSTTNTSPTATATTVSTLLTNVRITLASDAVPLPVELISFNATCLNNDKHITWATASETNNNYFELETSSDGETFTYLATIYGAGNSNQINEYAFDDISTNSDISYYRLKQVDYDGIMYYTGVISVQCGNENTSVDIYNPNQSKTLFISFNNPKDYKYHLLITDKLGRQLYTTIIHPENEGNISSINLNKLSSGTYNISVYSDNFIETKQIILCGFKN